MSPVAATLLKQALLLPEAERDWLASELSASLEMAMTPEQEAALVELLEHRRAEFLAGRAELIPAEEVFAQALATMAQHSASPPR